MNALVIEDDVKTAGYLRKGLSENAFMVDVANNGLDGLALALSGKHDIIILDVKLPLCDGMTILSKVRGHPLHTPVLLLTALDSVADRVKGLDLGADDYLVKPFAFSELLARIRSLLRRGQTPQPDVLRIEDLEIDFKGLCVTRGGKRISLSPKEFSLLAYLAERAGEVQSRTLIAEHVWNMSFDSATNVVDVEVCRLRRKIDEPFEKKLIRSVRGMGYVLERRE